MSRRSYLVGAVLAMLAVSLVAPRHVQAQEESDSPFGIGFQSSWPSYGLSGLYDMNERITLQAILGAFGTVTSFGARGLYRFQTEDKYDLYGFATAGMWSYDYFLDGDNTENVVGFGGGAGIELDWQRIISPEDDSFPPIYSSFDLGFVLANFDYYDFSGLVFGGGLHYRF